MTDRRTDRRNCDSICALTAYAVARKNTLRVWAPQFQTLDSTFSRLDYTFWLDSTLKICPVSWLSKTIILYCVKRNTDRRTLQQLSRSLGTLVSSNRKLIRVFAGVLWEGESNDSGVARHAHVLRSHAEVYSLYA